MCDPSTLAIKEKEKKTTDSFIKESPMRCSSSYIFNNVQLLATCPSTIAHLLAESFLLF